MRDSENPGRCSGGDGAKGSYSACILNVKSGFAEGLDMGCERKREAYRSDNLAEL